MFITDAQTVTDLGIFGKGGDDAIFGIYNRTHTRGGAARLEEMFRYPLSDAAGITRRSAIIRYFAERAIRFSFDRELFDVTAQYLDERDERTRLTGREQPVGQKITRLWATDTGYKNIVRGITALIDLLQALQRFLYREEVIACTAYTDERQAALSLLSEADFDPLLKEDRKSKLSQEKLAACDSLLRFRHHATVRKLLDYLYNIDVYCSVAGVARERDYCFPRVIDVDGQPPVLELKEVKHPGILHAKENDVEISHEKNVIFLTGANMAGKSTLMKSIGIAVYVAHLGFPVTAGQMIFTVLDGMYSTINLPDNLGQGASHFYAEVLRVKKVAEELRAGKKLFVLFDELFRGTNVRDAYEATIAVVEGFARKRQSLFVVSTHIIEAGEILQKKSGHIQYRFLPTRMQGHTPVYTYQLEEGITEDRHGMIIINNEGIIDMLKAGLRNQ